MEKKDKRQQAEPLGIKEERVGKKHCMILKAEDCVDLKEVDIQTDEPIAGRMMKYLAEVVDPYRFRVGKTHVHVVFGNAQGASLESGLEKILKRKM